MYQLKSLGTSGLGEGSGEVRDILSLRVCRHPPHSSVVQSSVRRIPINTNRYNSLYSTKKNLHISLDRALVLLSGESDNLNKAATAIFTSMAVAP